MSHPDPPLQPLVGLSRNQKSRKITPGKKRRIMARDGHRCLLCDAGEDLTIDHILPLSEGGSNHDSNLRVLCHDCNQHQSRQREAARRALGWPTDKALVYDSA